MENNIRIITQKMTRPELKQVAEERFGDMVKGVVDVEKGIMALGGEMHADEEAILLEHGSAQQNLWGVNLHVDLEGEDFVEFDSMINIRPRQNNRSRFVEDPQIREQIKKVIYQLTG